MFTRDWITCLRLDYHFRLIKHNCWGLVGPSRGDHSLLYFAYTCVRDLFIGGVINPAKKIIRWWYFTCKKLENIICDGILHVNMFHYFKIPYFTCNFFTKFTYNEYIGPNFLSHVVLRFLPVISPRGPFDEYEQKGQYQLSIGHNIIQPMNSALVLI